MSGRSSTLLLREQTAPYSFALDVSAPERQDLVEAAAEATSQFTAAMKRIQRAVTAEKEVPTKKFIPSPPQEQNTHTYERNIESVEVDESRPAFFESAREERFEGFKAETINSLLASIGAAVYDFDREICYAKGLFHDGIDVSMEQPLRVWDQIDPGQHLVPGKEWFDVDGEANNLSKSHAPITAALRKMIGTPNDEPLHISPELHDLSFSQVHTALIHWFVFDILNNKINLYLLPNMKRLRSMMTAVANFGNARWAGSGRQVLREVQLRAWHKEQFREEVVENVGWQGELICRLDKFLSPLNKNLGKIDPWSPARASIIKHTIELWTYLEASVGSLEIIHSTIGASFDGKTCENVDEDAQSSGNQNLDIKWLIRRGFRFKEDCFDGSVRPLMKKALVVIK